MSDSYNEKTSASSPPGKGAVPPNEDLIQVVPEFRWESVRPNCLCGCCGFVLQLVLTACCGSFLFGFNISLLNTALAAVNSSMQNCGQVDPAGVLIYRVAREESFEAALESCRTSKYCLEHCGKFTDGLMTDFKCPGGYTDLNCDALKWLNAVMSCAILIGGAAGAMTGGKFMGYGRRALLVVDMVIYAVGVICSVCSNSYSALLWGRLIVGYAVGVSSVGCPTYMSEMTPREKRGTYGVLHQLFITVGILIAMILGLPLVNPGEQSVWWEPPTFQEFWWRFMLGLGILPVLVGLALLFFVYTFETPVWYVEQQRYKDAYHMLEQIYPKERLQAELEVCIDKVRTGNEYKQKGLSFASAFANPEYRWVIFVGLGLAGFQQFGGINVFMTSSSDLFRRAGLNGTMQTVMSIVMAAINVIMTFPTIVLIERMGRKSLLFTGSLLQFIFVLPAAISYLTEGSNAENPSTTTQILAIVAILGFVTFFAVAFGPVVWVYLFEIYPMEIKDVAAAAATAFNWISGIIMVFVALVVPNQVAFSLFAILQLLGTLFVLFFMRETKGRALGDSPFLKKKEQVPV